MAGHRAAASVYATLGVAAATLLVVGGILAGPTFLECSRDPGGLGACLREKVAETGLIAPESERTERPDVVADIPSEPPVVAGWMQANANEYEPLGSGTVNLTGLPAELDAATPSADIVSPVEVAVAPGPELAATGSSFDGQTIKVDANDVTGSLRARATSPSSPIVPTPIALLGPEGEIAAQVPVPAAPDAGAALLTQPAGLIADVASAPSPAAPMVTPVPIGSPGAPTLIEPTPSEPAPVDLQAEASVEPVPAAPVIVVEFDPQYPNVLVLPPPVSGDNSSFRSLQLN